MPTLIDVPQRSPEWFAARAGRITASKVKDVLAKIKTGEAATRKDYKSQLTVERFTGVPVESGFMSQAMRVGVEREPLARAYYEAETGNFVEETGFWIRDDLAIGASPDGLIDANGGLEIKCPTLATHIGYLKAGKLPSEYEPQVVTSIWVLEREWWDFVSFAPEFPENLKLFKIRVYRDEKRIKEIRDECEKFLEEVEMEVELLRKIGEER